MNHPALNATSSIAKCIENGRPTSGMFWLGLVFSNTNPRRLAGKTGQIALPEKVFLDAGAGRSVILNATTALITATAKYTARKYIAAHPRTAFTIFCAASSRSSAEVTFKFDFAMISLPFSTLVPSSRTTSGT